MKKSLQYILIGFFIGAANTVPGISGGSIALICGIYEKLIHALKVLNPKKLLRRTNKPQLFFIFFLTLGALSGIFLCSLFIPFLMTTYKSYMNALFLGLMLSAIPHVFKLYKRPPKIHHYLLLLLSALLVSLLSAQPIVHLNNWPWQLLAGVIAMCAMLLPGISGGFALVVLGNYTYVLSELNQLLRFNLSSLINLLPFIIGTILGLITFVYVIDRFLKTQRSKVISVLIGLMIGSLKILWPFMNEQNAPVLPSTFNSHEALIMACFLFGSAFGIMVGKKSDEKTNS